MFLAQDVALIFDGGEQCEMGDEVGVESFYVPRQFAI